MEIISCIFLQLFLPPPPQTITNYSMKKKARSWIWLHIHTYINIYMHIWMLKKDFFKKHIIRTINGKMCSSAPTMYLVLPWNRNTVLCLTNAISQRIYSWWSRSVPLPPLPITQKYLFLIQLHPL